LGHYGIIQQLAYNANHKQGALKLLKELNKYFEMSYETYLTGDRSDGLSSIPDQMHLFGEPEYFKFGIKFWNYEWNVGLD